MVSGKKGEGKSSYTWKANSKNNQCLSKHIPENSLQWFANIVNLLSLFFRKHHHAILIPGIYHVNRWQDICSVLQYYHNTFSICSAAA